MWFRLQPWHDTSCALVSWWAKTSSDCLHDGKHRNWCCAIWFRAIGVTKKNTFEEIKSSSFRLQFHIIPLLFFFSFSVNFNLYSVRVRLKIKYPILKYSQFYTFIYGKRTTLGKYLFLIIMKFFFPVVTSTSLFFSTERLQENEVIPRRERWKDSPDTCSFHNYRFGFCLSFYPGLLFIRITW